MTPTDKTWALVDADIEIEKLNHHNAQLLVQLHEKDRALTAARATITELQAAIRDMAHEVKA